MRVYINKPEYFARLGTKVVLVFDHGNHKALIRRDNGDYDSVKTERLESIDVKELTQELLRNVSLREIAQNEGLIDIGDVHTDDANYLSMIWQGS